jgi:hypothetical protein
MPVPHIEGANDSPVTAFQTADISRLSSSRESRMRSPAADRRNALPGCPRPIFPNRNRKCILLPNGKDVFFERETTIPRYKM